MTVSTSRQSTVTQQTVVQEQSIVVNDSPFYLFMKRMMDICLSIIGLILLSPIFIITAILIKIEDPKGPILFNQNRVGKLEKQFKMYKFRSMVSNAEELKLRLLDQNEAEGPVFKIKDDPRVTKVGRFIRKTSIDELPQLINVLKGQMSLVGPRPPLPDEVAQYNTYEKQRLLVKPGLTCYWQVSGRSNLGFEEWVELDVKYIEERNLLLDIKLIFKTFIVLFGSKDAY
ncbi:priming glycosyltransferase [Gracilibacillus halophilus YIM-C55.5]|uniref:Priming glycosyltransferase n=1 Tax=Gracilibacillus halophilus YIM-C55.5 TaxID=1308866 RepID=N4WYJ3_9BACI|nr:sugar transferase [Gracilibacillus halophilus]ENH98101.1 priming glycosyltransferase [Gracilibacillus halophilus YIM-C55.5]